MATETAVFPNEISSSAAAKQPRKPRVVRRRGPVRADDLDDEPIERAPLSDSESEHSDDTATDDEEDEMEPPPPVAPVPPLDGASSTTPETSDLPSKESSHLWSDSVALDKAAGEDLPVIDFADLALVVEGDSEVKAPSTGEKDVVTPTAAPDSATGDAPAQGPPKSRPTPAHITARTAYLEKLNKDPSFIPRVGQFWGHDDRLMDKEMRPMSDWWRGRWQNRGRGRGGRGGFVGRGGRGGRPVESMDGPPLENQDPIDRKWEHDAYDDGQKGDTGARRGSNRARGWYKEKSGGRGGFKGGRGRGGSAAGSTVNAADIQARLQAEAAAKIASERGDSPAPTLSGAKPAKKSARPPNQRAKVKALLGQAAKENETANAQSVVTTAKNEVAAEKSQIPTTSAEVAVTQASGIKVNLPKDPARRRPPTALPNAEVASGDKKRSDSDIPNGNRRASGKAKSQGLEKVVLKDSFTKPGSTSNPTSDADQSPAVSQLPVVVNAPVEVQPSANPKYSYLTLPPGLAMGDSGVLYEIATGRPVVLNPPGAPTPPLPAPPVHMYNPRAVVHPRPGSMSYIPPHILSGLHPQTPPTPPHVYAPQTAGAYTNGSPVLHEPQPGAPRPPTFFAPARSGQRVQIRPPVTGSNGVKPDTTKDTPTTQPPPSYGSMPAPEQYSGYAPSHQPPAMNGQYYGGPQPVDPYYGTTYYPNPTGANGAQPPYQTPQNDDAYYGGATYYQQTPYGYPPQATEYGYNPPSGAPRNEPGSNGGYGFDGVQATDGQQQPQQMYY